MRIDSLLKEAWEEEKLIEERERYASGYVRIQPLLVKLLQQLDQQLVDNCRSPGTTQEVLTQITVYSVQCAVLTSIMEFFNSGVE